MIEVGSQSFTVTSAELPELASDTQFTGFTMFLYMRQFVTGESGILKLPRKRFKEIKNAEITPILGLVDRSFLFGRNQSMNITATTEK